MRILTALCFLIGATGNFAIAQVSDRIAQVGDRDSSVKSSSDVRKSQVDAIMKLRARSFGYCPSDKLGEEPVIFAVRSNGLFEILNKPLHTPRAKCLAVQLENARAGS